MFCEEVERHPLTEKSIHVPNESRITSSPSSEFNQQLAIWCGATLAEVMMSCCGDDLLEYQACQNQSQTTQSIASKSMSESRSLCSSSMGGSGELSTSLASSGGASAVQHAGYEHNIACSILESFVTIQGTCHAASTLLHAIVNIPVLTWPCFAKASQSHCSSRSVSERSQLWLLTCQRAL